MYTRHLLLLIAAALLTLVISSGTSAQQNTVTITSSGANHDWAIGGNQCYPYQTCFGNFRVDQNNVLYTMRDFVILAYPSNGYETRSYELQSTALHWGDPFDFEPLGNDYVAFFSTLSDGSYGFSLYNLETAQVTPVDLPINFIPCNPNSLPLGRSFMRLGTGSEIVACSRDANGYGFHILNLVDQSIVNSIYTADDEGDVRHRVGVMVAGQNGDFYLDTRRVRSSLLDELVPGTDSIPETDFVLRYSVQTAAWSVIQIPVSQLYRNSSNFEQFTDNSLIGVDASGNMYFRKSGTDNDGIRHIDIVKTNAQGTTIWRITEAELGVAPSNVLLLGEDDIFTFNGFDSGSIVTYSVNVTASAPTP